MAQSKSSKKLFNMAYGIGASVVILGALFKIMHWPFGNEMLILGLSVEALVFFISAFESVDDDLDWSLVYPELAGGQSMGKKGKQAVENPEDAQGLLSKKLDEMLKEARLDANLMSSLGDSIRSFEGAAKELQPTADSMNAQKKYSQEMSLAAAQMESLNSLYKVQVESASRQAQINDEVAQNADQLKQQMQAMATNLSSLNGVYGGMLSAMTNRN
jgi:gliding motility-associated protein GldL